MHKDKKTATHAKNASIDVAITNPVAPLASVAVKKNKNMADQK